MPLINYLESMDLDEPQKVLLREVIIRSCLTPASFKLMTDEQLRAIGFPLPAILEFKSLINAEPLTPTSAGNMNRTPATPYGQQTSTSSTPVSHAEINELTVDELKSLAAHIHVKSSNGLKQLTRLLVDEMVKVHEFFV